MDARVVFNFFNGNKTIIALCKYFNLPESNIEHFILKHYSKDRRLDDNIYLDFIREFDLPINELNTANAFITAKHITTFNDDGVSIRKYGLRNLKDALEFETPFKQFLRKNGITFDISNKKIIVNGSGIELARHNDIDPSKYDEAINKLYNKLYHDKCETEVFLCGEDTELIRYPYIRQHPEILKDIDNLLITLQQPLNLANKWAQLQNNKYYILEFDINITALEYINSKAVLEEITDSSASFENFEEYFDLFKYTPSQFYSDLIPKRFYSNLFLVQNSIDVIFTGKGREHGQIFPETVVPYEDLRILKEQIN